MASFCWAESGERVLARIDIQGPVTGIALPVYAHLRDQAGQEYVLVCADAGQLARTGLRVQLLETPAMPENYLLARPMRAGTVESVRAGIRVVHDDGVQWIVHATAQEGEALAESGFALARLPQDPIRWMQPGTGILSQPGPFQRLQELVYDPLVAEMIRLVQTNRLSALMRRITGMEPEVTGGDLYAIATRHSNSGRPIGKSTQFIYEHLQALGLDVRFHNWSSGRNVVGTLRGGVRSNEIVVIVAHLDNMPGGSVAPGADDNGSGTAGVLLAAEIFRQFHFERTIRFLLVTGEEQGLLGSAAYAIDALNAADHLVAVFNMDMISWDSNSDGVLDLYTRSTSDPGYSNDLAIASTFTFVAAQYPMMTPLAPRIFPNSSVWYSDHSSFWNRGFPAVLAIEAYNTDAYKDFNPYYHTTNDTFLHFNMPYFNSFVSASLGTVAHLALPVERVPLDLLEVANTAAVPGNGIGVGSFYARHLTNATETGSDSLDQSWAAAPAQTNSFWLKFQTAPDLRTDTRPVTSETLFSGVLSVVASNPALFSCTNRLRFDFLTPTLADRIYLARIHISGQYTATSNDFDCVTNLRFVVAGGGYLDLPSLFNVSHGVIYGTCEIATRFRDTDRSNCAFQSVSMDGSQMVIAATAQLGTRIEDQIEVSTNLLQTNGWHFLVSETNTIAPTDDSFESGWTPVVQRIGTSSLTNSAASYFRFRRVWVEP
jgi:hypothetical protein